MGSRGPSVGHEPQHTYAERVRLAVKAAMEANGDSQVSLAEGARIPRTSLQRRLDGVDQFRLGELERLAEYFGIPVDRLAAPEAAA